MKKIAQTLVLFGLLLSACRATPTRPAAPATVPPPQAAPPTAAPIVAERDQIPALTDAPWWNDAVFYEVFVRSFYDSDGDGVGDLNGLIEKLDYLNDGDPTTQDDLGVTAIWLMPIMQSPSYHGYDVVDYYTVDDEYGTNADFKRLMDEAHQRGIRVIVDMVLNHTSAQHPWFKDARSEAGAAHRNWYVWSEKPGAKGWHSDTSGYYYGIFWDQMPDLNYENPAVTTEMQNVVRFWLEDMGVDGFRLDAIKHLIEEGATTENTPSTHVWFEQEFFPFYKALAPDALTVGEVWSSTEEVAEYIGDEVDLAFEFDMASAFLEAAGSGSTLSLEYAIGNAAAGYPPGQFATFLANHDQTRTRSQLLNDAQAQVAATLQLTFPGVPFIYYGEEIGMQGGKPDENIRRPLQWTAEGGFSSSAPWNNYFGDQVERNVAAQQQDAGSLWQHYHTLIALRAAHPALRGGSWLAVQDDHRRVYSFARAAEEDVILVVVNLSQEPITEYTLTLAEGPFQAGMVPALLLGAGDVSAPVINAQGGFDAYRPVESVAAYGSVMIQYRP